MKINEIIEAWVIAYKPTEKQKKLAEERIKVCEICPHRKHTFVDYCDICGCPISKKVFTNSHNPCPAEKWEEIDNQFFTSIKREKTLF